MSGLGHLQQRQLVANVFPLRMIGQGRLGLGDGFPAGQLGQAGVEVLEVRQGGGQVGGVVDGTDRAFRHAHGAVDAAVRIDGQEIRAFHEAVHGADADAIGVLALDTGIGDDEGHGKQGKGQVKGRCEEKRAGGILTAAADGCRRSPSSRHRPRGGLLR